MHGRLFLAVAVLMTSITMACGGGLVTSRSIAPGELVVTPSTLDFGKVKVGGQKGQTGTLTAGNSSITVSSAEWSGEGYSVTGIVFPVTVPAGQSVNFQVTFTPHRAGDAPGNIHFVSDASSSTHVSFNGNGTQAPKHSVVLAWGAAPAAMAGYNVYRGVALEGPYTKINASPNPSLTFTDGSVVGGQTYFYMTTAVNKHGEESKHSNRVQVEIPNS